MSDADGMTASIAWTMRIAKVFVVQMTGLLRGQEKDSYAVSQM